MSPSRPSRTPRLSPTLALLVGLGAALPAADFTTTISVPASQTPGGVYVVGSATQGDTSLTVTYTVNFAETVVPGYLTGDLPEDKADVAVTGATSIYDLVSLTGSNGAAGATNIKMLNGRQMQVAVTGLTNGQQAALAITQGKFKGVDSSGVLTTNVNAAVAQRIVRVMLPADNQYHAKIDTPAYSLLESSAILLSGDFSDIVTTPNYATNPLYPDYVVKVTGSSAQINAYTLASGAWTAIVPAPSSLGRLTLTATPSDVVSSPGAAGTTGTLDVYIGQKPVVSKVQLTTGGPVTTDFVNDILVGHGQPSFSGTAGLPRDVDGTINGTLDTAGGRIRTRIDIFAADPVATPSTPPLITQKVINETGGPAAYDGATSDANAAWSLSSADYGATTLTGTGSGTTYYLRVVTEVIDNDGATGGNVAGVGSFTHVVPFKVSTTAPTAPTLDLDPSGSTATTFTTADNTPTIAVNLTGSTLSSSNVQVQYSTLADTTSATVTENAATGWKNFTVNSTTLPSAADSANFTPIVGESLADGVYKVRAIFTGSNGLPATSSVATLTVGTPVPGLSVAATTTDHKPAVTVTMSSGTLTAGDTNTSGTLANGEIIVEVKESSAADGAYVARAGYLSGSSSPYTWTPKVALPDGSFTFRARWKSADGQASANTASPPTVAISTPTPNLTPGGNITVTYASGNPADGNNQYLISDLKPKVKIGPWTDYGAGDGVTLNGTFTMYGVSRGTTEALITPYTLAASSTPWETANTLSAAITDSAIPGAVTKVGTDAVWTPTSAFANESAYSLFGKWDDANTANHTANDSNANNGTEAVSISPASNVFNLRVLSAVDAPALTGYSPSTDSNDTPDTAFTGTAIVASSGAIQIHGTGNPYATLQMYLGANKETQLTSIVVPANGKWVYEFSDDVGAQTTPLSDGNNVLSFRQIDVASATPSAYAPSITVTVDSGAPNVPAITSVESGAADDVSTADTTPELVGTATPGSTINVYVLAATVLASAGNNNDLQFVAKSQGKKVILNLVEAGNNTPLSLAVTGTGPYTITVNLATDGSGNGTSTANDVIALIRADSVANDLIAVALSGADAGVNTGAGAITASSVAGTNSDATGTLPVAVTADSITADVSTGAWSTDGSRSSPTLTAAATPGRLNRLFVRAKSPTGVLSGYSAGNDVYILSPSMKVYLEPIAKGDGGGYLINKAAGYAVGATSIAVDTGSETAFNTATADILEDVNSVADIKVGDVVTFAGDTNQYTVVTGLSGAAGTITISPGLKSLKADNTAMTIQSNPKGPASKGNGNTTASSQPQILLTATFKDGSGNPLDEVISTGFTASKIAITGGTVSTVTKGTGLPGQQPTNVWTIAITPSATLDQTMSVSIPAGAIATAPAKILDAITVNNPGDYYVGTPTITVGGGAAGSAQVTWTDGDSDKKIDQNELTIVDPGYGFASTATLTVTPSPGSGATGLAMTVSGGAIATVGGAAAATATDYNLVTKGSGYAAAPVVVFSGGTALPSQTIVPPVAVAHLGSGADAAKVVKVVFSSLGSNYATPPTMSFKTGSGFSASVGLKAGAILYNEASLTFQTGDTTTPTGTAYTLDIDRTKPQPVWKYLASGGSALRSSVALAGEGTQTLPATGNYVLLSSTPSETYFILRAHFPSVMNRTLVPGDLTLVGCSLDTTYDSDGILDVGGTHQDFDIKLKRGGAAATVTTMSVTIKAAPGYDHDANTATPAIVLSDTASPAQTSLASVAFAATVVPVPSAPVIASATGIAGVPSRTGSYSCTATFSSAVTGFTADDLTVSNGVISKFAGSGKNYTFTLTPGEGPVTVQYLSTTGLQDVAGQSVPNSNLFQRVLDSTQPTAEAVSSPILGQSGAVKPTGYATTYFNATTLAYTGAAPATGSVQLIRLPVRVTFSEAPKSVPAASILATVVSSAGANLTSFTSGAAVKIEAPTVVGGTANKTYSMNLLIPTTGSGKVRLVVPAFGVPDNATNQSAASGVYEIEYDHASGTVIDLSTAPFNNG